MLIPWQLGLVSLITGGQRYCVWVAFPPPLRGSFSSADSQNSEMQSNIGTVCNSTCIKCSHSSVPGGNLQMSSSRKTYVSKSGFILHPGSVPGNAFFPVAGAKQYWRKVLFCYSVGEFMARIQETEGCIVIVKGDRRF